MAVQSAEADGVAELLMRDVDDAWIDTNEELETAANDVVVIITENEVVVATTTVVAAIELETTSTAPPPTEMQPLS